MRAQAVFGVAAGVSVVGDEGLSLGAGDQQFLVVQFQGADLGVLQQADTGGFCASRMGAALGSYKIFVAGDRPEVVVGTMLRGAAGVCDEDDALA